MISPRISTLALVFVACLAGAVALGARGQSTARPGEPTQARVWVENRAPNEAIPVAIESSATPLRVQVDPANPIPIVAVRQVWEYRSIPLVNSADAARGLAAAGMEGWEAVGVLQSGSAGTTVLVKRPR